MRQNSNHKPKKRRTRSILKKYSRNRDCSRLKNKKDGTKRTYARIKKLNPKNAVNKLQDVYNWGLIDLCIPEAHKKSMGEGINIAVIDTGRPDHYDLKNQIVSSKNFTHSEDDLDRNGHSTFVCGLIAAEFNHQGTVGVSPRSKLYIAKALDDAGIGTPNYLTKAVAWAVKKKVDLISISAGFNVDYVPLHEAIKNAYKKNITVIAAAGNSGMRYGQVMFPARYPEVIAVGAYNKDRKATKFSSRGINVMFAMPGYQLYSTWLDNGFNRSSGTSFACPILTGICSLIISSHRRREKQKLPVNTPCNTSSELVEHLHKYAIKLGNINETGFGTLNLTELLEAGI